MDEETPVLLAEVKRLREDLNEAEKRRKRPGFFAYLAAGFVLLLVVAQLSGPKTPESRKAAYCVSDAGTGKAFAIAAAEVEVEKLLISPAGADFSPASAVVEQQATPCTFGVAGIVDAPNLVGVKLRRTYVARVTYDPASDRWTADNAKLVGR